MTSNWFCCHVIRCTAPTMLQTIRHKFPIRSRHRSLFNDAKVKFRLLYIHYSNLCVTQNGFADWFPFGAAQRLPRYKKKKLKNSSTEPKLKMWTTPCSFRTLQGSKESAIASILNEFRPINFDFIHINIEFSNKIFDVASSSSSSAMCLNGSRKFS